MRNILFFREIILADDCPENGPCAPRTSQVRIFKKIEKKYLEIKTILFSVIGRPSAGGLCFPEYVIYRGEQAYPEYLINYLIQKPT